MAKRVTKNTMTYSEASAELESILSRMRSKELGIDELTGAVRRAQELIAICRTHLQDVGNELQKIGSEQL
jgi:exodeoxyribonuclease VII small subunit